MAQQKMDRRGVVRWLTLGALAVLAVLLLFAWRSGEQRALYELAPPNRLGPADAPVQIVEFSDFGCPACRDWHERGIRDQLLAEFGDQVSFEYRHLPVITAQSPLAAEAAQCAAEQGAFWAYHDYIFEEAPHGALREADLRAYATAVSLDQTQFNACLDSGKFAERVAQDRQAAERAGARGTPTFFVNGQQAFPTYNGLAEAVRAALK